MRRSLPSLVALRSFEAVARHLSFTKAADELCVTQSAISHQVKALEEHLHTKLFRRCTREIFLTEDGQRLFEVTRVCFDQVAAAATEISLDSAREQLDVKVTPLFSGKWLVPRVPRFTAQYPEIDLRLHHDFIAPAANDFSVDLSIYFGDRDWGGMIADPLFHADIIPFCSPDLIAGTPSLDAPADLVHHTLIHEFDYSWWEEWLERAGVTGIDVQRGMVVDDPNVLVNAAIGGQGVILGPPAFLADYVDSGQLAIPFANCPPIFIEYFLVFRPDIMNQSSSYKFREWILAEAARYISEFSGSV